MVKNLPMMVMMIMIKIYFYIYIFVISYKVFSQLYYVFQSKLIAEIAFEQKKRTEKKQVSTLITMVKFPLLLFIFSFSAGLSMKIINNKDGNNNIHIVFMMMTMTMTMTLNGLVNEEMFFFTYKTCTMTVYFKWPVY